ncbi:MAG: riboflavin kinase [Nitrososphaerota archaeon]
MQYVFTLPEYRQSAIVAISSFDGVHRGHQRLLAETITLARQHGVMPVAILPWPPMTDDPEHMGILTTLSERIALIERFAPGIQVVVLPADAARPWSPATLMERITSGWEIKGIMADTSCEQGLYGRELADMVRRHSALEGTPVYGDESAGALGARLRTAIIGGEIAEAARQLAYEYSLSGEVVGGDRRGRLLGFPTANLRVDTGKVIPGNGIYAVRVGLPGERSAARPAVASVGVRPTFGDGNTRLVEVHLLDLSMDLYGVRLETAFVEWLRPEERFASVEALIHQMTEDVQQARQRLADPGRIATGSESSLEAVHRDDAHP